MNYPVIAVLSWILCGILDLIIFSIKDEYNHLNDDMKEELAFFESRMGIGYHIILWTLFISYSCLSGPISLYWSWKNRCQEST